MPAVSVPAPPARPSVLVDTGVLNDAADINAYLQAINARLPIGGRLVVRVETYGQLARRVGADRGRLAFALHVLVWRVFPKLGLTRRLWAWAMAGRRHALSLTEALGRLAFCGFRILSYHDEGETTRVVVEKEGAPRVEPHPSCGLLLRIDRVGRGGTVRTFYKVRTMHPYARYLQAHVYEQNALDTSGKLRADFRVTGWGRVLRRLWIDELPMLLNLVRGDVKLVGVRPLSEHFFNLYPEDVRALRIRHRPGLLPPFYADLPTTLEGVVESERRYLEAYERAPIRTDLRYLRLVLSRILFDRARSA